MGTSEELKRPPIWHKVWYTYIVSRLPLETSYIVTSEAAIIKRNLGVANRGPKTQARWTRTVRTMVRGVKSCPILNSHAFGRNNGTATFFRDSPRFVRPGSRARRGSLSCNSCAKSPFFLTCPQLPIRRQVFGFGNCKA